jgi:hypothetical protein
MVRLLQSLLALISLLLLALLSATTEGATLPSDEPNWRPAHADPIATVVSHVLPSHRHFAPGPQPGTKLRVQPFAYGYFGARAQPAAVYHRCNNGDWFQWSFYRAD